MKRLFATIALSFSLAMTVPVVLPQTAVVAAAAEKAEAECYENKIGINAKTQIELSNTKKKATYTYSTNKKSVATVSKKGVVTGKSAGKAKITVKETYKGKTTTVGKITITVKKAVIDAQTYNDENWIPTQTGWITKSNPGDYTPTHFLQYENPKATYTIYSDTEDLTITKKGKITAVKQTGTATLTIKETYKGKTRKVGSFQALLMEPTYTGDSVLTAYVSYPIGLYSYMKACNDFYFCYGNEELPDDETLLASINDGSYTDSTDAIISRLSYDDEEWIERLSIDRVGNCYCALAQYNYLTETYDKIFGRFQINVPDTSTADRVILQWDEGEDLYGDESFNQESSTLTCDLFLEEYVCDIFTSTEYYSGTYTVTSSNPEVAAVTIEQDNDWGDNGARLHLKFLSAGTTTITIDVNGASRSFTLDLTDEF